MLGVTGALELVILWRARLGQPIWRQSDARVRRRRNPGCGRLCNASAYLRPLAGEPFPGLLGNVVAGRIANRLDLGGTNCVVDAACASSLAPCRLAISELHAGRADMVVTGGVDTFNDIFMYHVLQQDAGAVADRRLPAVSTRRRRHDPGRRAGDAGLKRLDDARARRRPDLRGDPRDRASSRRQGQERLRAARPRARSRPCGGPTKTAGWGPETVELVEAHGTGTKVGDAAELASPAEVFDEPRDAEAAGARWARSSRRSATPRRRRAPPG